MYLNEIFEKTPLFLDFCRNNYSGKWHGIYCPSSTPRFSRGEPGIPSVARPERNQSGGLWLRKARWSLPVGNCRQKVRFTGENGRN